MQRLVPLMLLLTLVGSFAPAAADELPFNVGEKLIFSASYGDTMAGIAVLHVEKWVRYQGRDALKLTMKLDSSAAFSDFFYVQDRIETIFDPETRASLRYEKRLLEGDYVEQEVLYYDQEAHTITSAADVRTGIVPGGCDTLAVAYNVRFAEMTVGGSFTFPYADATRNETVTVRVLDKETVSVPAGTFECYKLLPELRPESELLDGEGEEYKLSRVHGEVYIWVTADERKLPVKIVGKTWFGEVVAQLEAYHPGG